MQKAGYDDLAPHKREHGKLTDQVHDIVARFAKGNGDGIDDEVLTFLKNWLTGHILGVDMRYTPYLRGMTLTPEEVLSASDFHLAGADDDDGSMVS